MATFTVAASADDGWSYVSGSAFTTDQDNILMGDLFGTSTRAFFRFNSITIPQGSNIISAFVRFTSFDNRSETTCNLKLHFEAADNPSAPSSGADNISRSLTTGTNWNSLSSWSNGSTYDTPDISSELQEVVDRGGWASGQSVIFFAIDNNSSSSARRQASSYDLSEPAELHVVFGVNVSDIVAVTENINILLSFSGALPPIGDDLAVTESFSVELFQNWLLGNRADQIGISENIVAALEGIAETLKSETIAVTESITASLAVNASVVETIGLEEYLKTALDIPTSWISLANAGLAIEHYYFTLTGDADGTTDIEIPIESFQARKRTGEATYLAVVIRDFATYSAAIADRANGEMVVEMAYEYNGETSIRQEIARAELEDIRLYEGASNRSIGLTGHKTTTFANRSVTLENATYKATVEGRRTFRFAKCDPWLNPGDTLVVGSDSMTVDYITYIVSAGYKAMEVREIG